MPDSVMIYQAVCTCFSGEGNWSIWKRPMQAQGEQAKSKQIHM